MRTAAKVDANQAEIVTALRQAGATVQILAQMGHGVPDLLVGSIHRLRGTPNNFLMEVKMPGENLTPDEMTFHATWRGPILIVHNVKEALAVIGVKEEEAQHG